jgi:hypothetical protein
MYNIKLYDYAPEPKPVTSDFLICAHHYPAWKWGAAGLHNGFNDLHDYPERTPLMGYYDEENPAVCDWEIKWASEHGINCFIYCWYRKKDNEGKPLTPADLRCGHGLHEAMFNARYQKHMKFAIMYEANARWGGTDAKDLLDNLMPFWMGNYFKRDNYVKLDGKPVLFVYDTSDQVKNAFASPTDQKAAYDACRDYAIKEGFPGLIIALMNTSNGPAIYEDTYARGYDFRFAYNSPNTQKENFPPEDEKVEELRRNYAERLAQDPKRFIVTASCFRDHTPRFSEAWIEKGYHFSKSGLWYLSPENFRRQLKNCREMVQALPEDAYGRRIVMIDNWNEWDEGHFVSPSHGYGFGYLQAIREELTHRDNLPDYRMPQDVCPGDYNKSWDIPDFTGVSRKDYYVRE